jgi:hypothetical protein
MRPQERGLIEWLEDPNLTFNHGPDPRKYTGGTMWGIRAGSRSDIYNIVDPHFEDSEDPYRHENYLTVSLGCGCFGVWTKREDVPEKSVYCPHNNLLIGYDSVVITGFRFMARNSHNRR